VTGELVPRPGPYDGDDGDLTSEHGRLADVGAFRTGSPISRWALSRYLVGRAVASYIGWALFGLAVALVGLGMLLYFVGPSWLGVLVVILGFGVLAVRALLATLLRRLTSVGRFGELDARLRALVGDTRKDVRQELRRIGLPSRVWTMPVLVVRLAGRRRARTLELLRGFDVARVVPAARLDELHLLVISRLTDPPR